MLNALLLDMKLLNVKDAAFGVLAWFLLIAQPTR